MHYISYNFEVRDLYGSHQVSLHIYFNKDTAFYKILSSWHIHHSWITPPVPSLYLLEKIQALHYDSTCQTPNLQTLLQNYLNFITCDDSQKTMENDMSECIKIVKKKSSIHSHRMLQSDN